MQFATTLVALCAAVSAITITNPPRDNSPRPVQYNNGSITITWTSSPGEPTSLDVVLSTNNGQSLRTIASGIPTSAGSYAVDLTGVAPGQNYAVNLNNDPASGSTGILAQSGTFTVAQGEVASSSSAAAASSAPASSSAVAASSAVATSSGMVTSSAGSGAVSPIAMASGAGSSGAASASATSSAASGAASAAPSASGSSGVSGASGASGTARASGASGTAARTSPSSTTASSATALQVGSFAVAAVAALSYFL